MDENPKTEHNRGTTKDGHTQAQRFRAIAELLREEKSKPRSLAEIAKKMRDKKGIEVDPATIGRAKKILKFEKGEDGRYRMPDTAAVELLNEEIKEICNAARISPQSMIGEIRSYAIRTNGYSHLLASKLKERFKEIIDVQPLENILIVYYRHSPKTTSFESDLTLVMTGKRPPRKYVPSTAKKEDAKPVGEETPPTDDDTQ